jgi:uncharacterized membrane protein
MATRSKADWLIPGGLVVLSLVPAIAGSARLAQFASGVVPNDAGARFHADPAPMVWHIVAVVIYSLLGAFQFSPGFRRRNPRWHRIAGRILLPAGMIAALSGLYMAGSYPWPPFDGFALYVVRLIVGTSMAMSLVLGFRAVLRRDFTAHSAWMIRAYALGLGAGTQVFTHIPYIAFPEIQGELSRTICMAAGWAINYVVAEWIIARGRAPASATALPLRFARDPRLP